MWYVVVLIIAVIAAYALRQHPQSQPPAGLGDIDAPTAEIGREIPVLFGTRKLSGPNVVWYGDLRTIPVRKSGGKK